jgi:signal transduction histidine kinase
LAEELGRRAATAIDNAHSYRAEQEARREAEFTTKRIASLQAVTAALSEAVTPAQVAAVILEKGLAALGADSGAIVLLDKSGEDLRILHHFGYPAEGVDPWRSFPLSSPAPLAETVRTGEPIFIETMEELQIRYPDFAKQRISRHLSLVSLPLTIEGRLRGAIGLSFNDSQTFSAKDRGFMVVLARQCSQALERARLYEAERSARAEAEAAQQRLAILAETRERNRMAQELHDTVAQALGYLNLKIATTISLLGNDQNDTVEANLQEIKNIVAETYTDVREEIFNLRANVFEGLSFLELLDKYIDKYRNFYNLDVQLILEADETLLEFPTEVGPQLIRTIQEALINVRKHARVNQATIRFSRYENEMRISVEDQGQGFDPIRLSTATSSFGLQIMRERVESVGGSLEIDSAPGQGTRIILHYPLP